MFITCVPANVALYSIFAGLFRRFLCFFAVNMEWQPILTVYLFLF